LSCKASDQRVLAQHINRAWNSPCRFVDCSHSFEAEYLNGRAARYTDAAGDIRHAFREFEWFELTSKGNTLLQLPQ